MYDLTTTKQAKGITTMTTLSTSTWEALSHEYLDFRSTNDDPGARSNAVDLAKYVWVNTRVDGLDGSVTSIYHRNSRVRWVPVDNAEPYETYEALRWAWANGPHPLQVSDCYHDHPVWSREDNLRFRVWHDTGHLTHNLGFSADEELELFILQARGFHLVTGARQPELVDALFSESVYQLAAAKVLGTFPDKQFVRTPGPVGRAVLDAWGFGR
jgi:hypothetical protein